MSVASTTDAQYVSSCPKGIEALLAAELTGLGAEGVRETVAGVYFEGSLEIAYRVCLWSRLANKVLLPLGSFTVNSQEELYDGARALPWQEHLSPTGTLLV